MMVLTGTKFMENPYGCEWEEVMELKDFCKKYCDKYKAFKLNRKTKQIDTLPFEKIMEKMKVEFSQQDINYITHKYQEVMKDVKVYFELCRSSKRDNWVRALFLCSVKPSESHPTDTLFILYRQTLNRIALLEIERRYKIWEFIRD